MGTIAALAINPTLYGNLPFDPLKDLAPVTQAVDSTNILVVHPTVQAKTVKELIALAKTKPLNGGSSGVGGAGHLALELFNVMAGTKITHVPYKGGGPAMTDLVGGQINLIFATAASAVPHVKSGKIRALAVTTAKRSKLVARPADRRRGGAAGVRSQQLVRRRRARQNAAADHRPPEQGIHRGAQHAGHPGDALQAGPRRGAGTPEAFGAYIKSETVKWAKVIKASGAKPE